MQLRQWIDLVEASFDAYHGTSSSVDFDAFSLERFATGAVRGDQKQLELPAIWASQSANVATTFAGADPFGRDADHHARVIPVHVRMDHPLIVDMAKDGLPDRAFNHPDGKIWNINDFDMKNYFLHKAKDAGHDGVIFKNGYDAWMEHGDLYAVFSADQVTCKYGHCSEPR